MNEQDNIPTMPQPDFSNWEKASKDDLIAEIKNLRRHAALLTQIVSELAKADREKMNAAYEDIVTLQWQAYKSRVDNTIADFSKRLEETEKRVGIRL